MKANLLNTCFLSLVCSLSISLFASPSQPLSFGPSFSIKEAPSPGDWQRFHLLSETALKDLWEFHSRKNLTLKDWRWQWRLGWLRACGDAARWSWCEPLLREGLFDAAMVVRAEAAGQWAESRKENATLEDVSLLKKAYTVPGNIRRGKPLYVCEKILNALATLNTSESKKAGVILARKHKHTLAFWNTLQSAKTKHAQATKRLHKHRL